MLAFPITETGKELAQESSWKSVEALRVFLPLSGQFRLTSEYLQSTRIIFTEAVRLFSPLCPAWKERFAMPIPTYVVIHMDNTDHICKVLGDVLCDFDEAGCTLLPNANSVKLALKTPASQPRCGKTFQKHIILGSDNPQDICLVLGDLICHFHELGCSYFM